jgi:LmbE family N-acetylglucosaminyl deacetylase
MLETLLLDGPILVLAPHLDDGPLSAGGLMHAAAKRGTDVVVGTTFTADAPEHIAMAPIVKQVTASWGLGSKPYEVRRGEDIASIQSLGARFIHGDLLDSIYRTDEDGEFLYPKTTSRFGLPHPKDPVRSALRDLLARWIDHLQPAAILCPLGVGRHVDHVVMSETLQEISAEKRLHIYLYEDIPYAAGLFPAHAPDSVLAAITRSNWTIGPPLTVSVDADRKIAAVMKYTSQIGHLFPEGRSAGEELKRYMRLESNAFHERLWSVKGS